MKRCRTRFALAGKGGAFGASGFTEVLLTLAPITPVSPNKPANATAPIPIPVRCNNSRRVKKLP